MSELDIIRAWKDPVYRKNLSREELEQLPEHPAGLLELPDADLTIVVGGQHVGIDATQQVGSLGCCGGWTNAQTGFCNWTCNCSQVNSCNPRGTECCIPISAGV